MSERSPQRENIPSESEVIRMTKAYVQRIRQNAGKESTNEDEFVDIPTGDLAESIRLGITPRITGSELSKIHTELIRGITSIPQENTDKLGVYLLPTVEILERIIGITTLVASTQDTY